MTDIAHGFGADLSLGAGGDLGLATGTGEIQQRVLHRLLTAAGSYLWQLDYGSGLPAMVGQPVSLSAIQGIVAEQMALEAAVDQTRPIDVSMDTDNLGSVVLRVTYTNAKTGQGAILALT